MYLEFDRFWRVWFRRTNKVSFKSSCFLDWHVMFTKVVSIDKIELIYMAVVFIFCWVPYFFVNCPPKCHDTPSLEWNLISVKLWRIKRSDQTDCSFSIGTWTSYNTQEMSEIRVSSKIKSKIDRTALTETLS